MSRKTSCLLSFALASQILLSLGVSADAQQYKAGAIVIDQPWSRATPRGSDVGVGYLTIANTGPEPDRLVSASSPRAGRTEIHEMKMEGGVMKMRPVAGGLEIKPAQKLELKPGGYHVMFMNLHEPFKQGEMLKAQLQFEKAGTLDVEFKVEGTGAQAPHKDMQMN